MTQSDTLEPFSAIVDGGAPPSRLAYVLVDGFALMSFAPVLEPFRAANSLSGKSLYSWECFSIEGGSTRASNGLQIGVDGSVEAIERPDVVFVCAGGNPSLFNHRRTLQILRRLAQQGTTLCGVSGGPFILGRAGLLDGYRCTIHWEHEDSFVETFPKARHQRSLYVADRGRLTCAGGLAGLDLAIALIQEKFGSALAASVSDWYVHTHKRSSESSQRSSIAHRYRVWHKGLCAVLAAMEQNIAEPLTRAELAGITELSIRQLERLFSQHLHCTIGAHYLKLRLDYGARLLRETDLSRTEVAMACGFVSVSHFARAFRERFSVPPTAIRRR